jgi:DNA polymerase-3 subunit epsilon
MRSEGKCGRSLPDHTEIFDEAIALKLVAIDFETADCSADSACAIGVVTIERGRITQKGYQLIRPPRRNFVFSYIHGITWVDVMAQPSFIEVWDHFRPCWKDADYFLAHNAPFDRNVLTACCSAAGRRPPKVPFICTVRVARSHWNFRPANLPAVCTQLGISLKHHDAASDALACASIALRAMKEGFPIVSAVVGGSHQARRRGSQDSRSRALYEKRRPKTKRGADGGRAKAGKLPTAKMAVSFV